MATKCRWNAMLLLASAYERYDHLRSRQNISDMEWSTILCGDIGGTNSRLRLFKVGADEHIDGANVPGELLFQKEYANETYASFDDVVLDFFRDASVSETQRPRAACFAVAGPVDNNRVAFTNRSAWVVDGAAMSASLGMEEVRLINDFVANGYGLLTLDEATETVTIQDVPHRVTRAGAPIACVGAGTGLGETFMTAGTDGVYEAWPTEGGHAEFAPRTELQIELLRFLKKKFSSASRVSVERVVSGIGLANVYEFLRQAECGADGAVAAEGARLKDRVMAEVDAEIQAAGDQMGGVVAKHAATCFLCGLAMDIMFTTYGSEVGVAALKYIPYGGLYIAGGIAPKNVEYLTAPDSKFLEAFRDKGRVSGVLTEVPVKLVLATDIGQRGAHLVAMRTLTDLRDRHAKYTATTASVTACLPQSTTPSQRYRAAATAAASLRSVRTRQLRAMSQPNSHRWLQASARSLTRAPSSPPATLVVRAVIGRGAYATVA